MLGGMNSGEHIHADDAAHIIQMFVRLLTDVSDLLARIAIILKMEGIPPKRTCCASSWKQNRRDY